MCTVIDYICEKIRADDLPDIVTTITDVLVKAGFDLRHEPSLEDVKRILVAATRTASECSCVA